MSRLNEMARLSPRKHQALYCPGMCSSLLPPSGRHFAPSSSTFRFPQSVKRCASFCVHTLSTRPLWWSSSMRINRGLKEMGAFTTVEPWPHIPGLRDDSHFTTNLRGRGGGTLMGIMHYNCGFWYAWTYDIPFPPMLCCSPAVIQLLRYARNQTAPGGHGVPCLQLEVFSLSRENSAKRATVAKNK